MIGFLLQLQNCNRRTENKSRQTLHKDGYEYSDVRIETRRLAVR